MMHGKAPEVSIEHFGVAESMAVSFASCRVSMVKGHSPCGSHAASFIHVVSSLIHS